MCQLKISLTNNEYYKIIKLDLRPKVGRVAKYFFLYCKIKNYIHLEAFLPISNELIGENDMGINSCNL